MPAMPPSYTVHAAPSMREIDAAQWDACANPGKDLATPLAAAPLAPVEEPGAGVLERYNPFVTHAFLSALEASKSAWPGTGWIPAHILVKDANGRLAAAAPGYL